MRVLALLDLRTTSSSVDHAQFLDLVDGDLRGVPGRFGAKRIIRSRQITDLDVRRQVVHGILVDARAAVETPYIISDHEFLPHARAGVPEGLVQVQVRI